MTMKKQAQALAKAGRYGDDSIVHMNKREIAALDGIASLAGRRLTKNPKTGATEAFNLFDILPLALNFIAPGMGTAAQIAISAASGAASAGMEGRDPLTGALMGGITSGIAGNLFGPSEAAKLAGNVGADAMAKIPGVDAAMASAMGMPAEQATKIAADAAQAAAKQGANIVGQAPLSNASYLTDIFGAGSDAAIDSTIGSLLSKQNLPLTLMGASMIAPMLDQPTDGSSVRPDYSPNLRNPGPARQYTPFTGDYSTYGQTGGEAMQVYQPGRLGMPYQYTGSEYTGDPRDYPFKEGGMVQKYGLGGPVYNTQDTKMPPVIPPMVIPSGPSDTYGARAYPNFNLYQAPQADSGGGNFVSSYINRVSGRPGKGSPNRPAPTTPQAPPPPRVPFVQNPNLVAGATQGQQVPIMMPKLYAAPQIMPATMSDKGAPVPQINPGMANGGYVAGYARGGIASVPGKVDPGISESAMRSKKNSSEPRFIGGDHKGMDDTIPAKIDGKTPARLSSGEFVIPADVVSMLGDGNTAAGARALKEMIQRIRVQKTGTGEQAAPMNEMDAMPA